MTRRLLPYIPRLTVDWARRTGSANSDAPQCQTLDATMVFGDVSGFTKMSERLARHGKVGAEEIADAINTCFEELLGVANRAGGSLLKFGGDALFLLVRRRGPRGPGRPRSGRACGAPSRCGPAFHIGRARSCSGSR